MKFLGLTTSKWQRNKYTQEWRKEFYNRNKEYCGCIEVSHYTLQVYFSSFICDIINLENMYDFDIKFKSIKEVKENLDQFLERINKLKGFK